MSDKLTMQSIARLVPQGSRVLDLGCGAGEWTLRALQEFPAAEAVAVDLSEPALRRAGAAARERRLDDRVTFVRGDAREHRPPRACDLVLCVGATHVLFVTSTIESGGRHGKPTPMAVVNLIAVGTGEALFSHRYPLVGKKMSASLGAQIVAAVNERLAPTA